jgi:RimJ/RimL family protein N-acetyltransferase
MEKTLFKQIETPRLLLRHFTDADLAPFLAYRNDPKVARYQGWEHISEDSARAFINEQKAAQPGIPGQYFQFAIALKTTGELIGDCMLHISGDDPTQAEIGFTLSRAYQKQGFAKEAITGLLDYIFGTLELRRVIAIADCENTASWGLMERLGMRREGHFIQNVWFKGRWVDEYQYAVLQSEWLAKQNQQVK